MGTEKDVGRPQVSVYTCTDGYTQACMHRNHTQTQKLQTGRLRLFLLLAPVLTWLQRVCAKQTTQVDCPNINCPAPLDNLGPAVFPKPHPLPGYSPGVQLYPRPGMFEGTLQIPKPLEIVFWVCCNISLYTVRLPVSWGMLVSSL